MPINSLGMNDDYVSYFSLEEYIDRIQLSSSILDRSQGIAREFDNYMDTLSRYDEEYIVNYWIFLLYQELNSSQRIENSKFDMRALANRSVFFDSLNINHKRIHELHNFVVKKEIDEGLLEETFDYRTSAVNVSRYTSEGKEEIFWRGANPEDVKKFMDDFVKIYSHGGISALYSNPFLSSSLMHLLFVRIHPYIDGNGRTARVIHNIKFTDMVNKLYGTRLKISPLNLSDSILVNKITYVKRINNIYFDLQHDNSEAINKWFDFILDMVEERLYVANNLLRILDESKMKKLSVNEEMSAKKMRLSKIKQR